MKKYKINNIFGATIQGEGSFTGLVVAFVRFFGCNRSCPFCDTNITDYEEVTSQEILNRLELLDDTFDTVVLTGGEPCLQIDLELLDMLWFKYNIHLETNGSIDIRNLSAFFKHISCSPKQSAVETYLQDYDDLKVIWPYQHCSSILEYKRPNRLRLIQPIHGTDIKNDVLLMRELYKTKSRLSIQVHKFCDLD